MASILSPNWWWWIHSEPNSSRSPVVRAVWIHPHQPCSACSVSGHAAENTGFSFWRMNLAWFPQQRNSQHASPSIYWVPFSPQLKGGGFERVAHWIPHTPLSCTQTQLLSSPTSPAWPGTPLVRPPLNILYNPNYKETTRQEMRRFS